MRTLQRRDLVPRSLKDLDVQEPKGWRKYPHRLGCWLLRDAEFLESRIEYYDRVAIDDSKIIEELRLSKYEIQDIWDRRVTEILVGHDYAARLFNAAAARESWDCDISMRLSNCPGGDRCLGLKVRVVPWMDGVLLI